MKYRSRTEITSHILQAANGGTTKTKVMYRAYLSYAQLKEYLPNLIENGLLANDVAGVYKTTSKGIKFLETARQIDGLFILAYQEK
jgi:predicted transcriptional regulator